MSSQWSCLPPEHHVLGPAGRNYSVQVSTNHRRTSRHSSRPIFRMIAPVKAPRSLPKSSLSSRPLGMAAQLSFTNERSFRRLRLWMARGRLSQLNEPTEQQISEAAERQIVLRMVLPNLAFKYTLRGFVLVSRCKYLRTAHCHVRRQLDHRELNQSACLAGALLSFESDREC